MNKKTPAALAIAVLAVASTWAPRGWSQSPGLPPQLQTDAQRSAARTARAPAAGGLVQPSNAAGGDAVAAALGAAVLADAVDAAAASARNAAMRPRRSNPVVDWRGGVDPGTDAEPDDPRAPVRDEGPQ